MRLAFIGVGNIGSLVAAHLLGAGHDLTVFDVREEATRALVAHGARRATSAARAAKDAEAIFAALPTPTSVEQTVFGVDGLLTAIKAGQCLIDMTTNDPALVRRVAGALAEHGATMLEVPVSGGLPAARAGKLTAMVGGDAVVLERYRPLLRLFCDAIFHLGAPGSGNTAKVITNMLACANTIAAAEGMILGRKAGLDLETLWRAILASVGRSFAAEFYFPNGIFDGSFPVRFRLDLMAKDLDIANRLARDFNVPLEIGSRVEGYLKAAQAQGLGPASNSTVVTVIEQAAGVDLRIGSTGQADDANTSGFK